MSDAPRERIDAHLAAAVRAAVEAVEARDMVFENRDRFAERLVGQLRDLMREQVRAYAGHGGGRGVVHAQRAARARSR